MKLQRTMFVMHSTDFVDIGGKPLIKKSVREESSVSNVVSLINGLMIYSVVIRKSTLDFHKESI